MLEALRNAFIHDHKHLIRGLTDLRDALTHCDLPRARALADTVDQEVGAHIEFEETVFYPELARLLGSDFVGQLYHEHATGKEAVAEILAMPPDDDLAGDRGQELARQVEVALEHALSCGTLLSHIERVDDERQMELLAALEDIRNRGHRWTLLPDVEDSAD